jgi:chromosome segregation ATPase
MQAKVEELKLKLTDKDQHIFQLKNELAEFQGKPEAFERLRRLLQKEKLVRRREHSRSMEIIKELREPTDCTASSEPALCECVRCKLERAQAEIEDLKLVLWMVGL